MKVKGCYDDSDLRTFTKGDVRLILANLYRGGEVENSHRGHVAIVDSQENVIAYVGNPKHLTYTRSTLKPVQAIPLIETGAAERFSLDQSEIALSCASHSSEEEHAVRVRAMLQKAGLSEANLHCGGHPPLSQKVWEKFIAEGKKWTPIYSNCSGKHAGMLLTAMHKQISIHDYEKMKHPIQQQILSAIVEMTHLTHAEIGTAIDGCGVPVFRMPLSKLAFVYARLADPKSVKQTTRQSTLFKIAEAMVHYPELVAGKGRFCTELMKAFQGRLIGKVGADGVYAIADRKMKLGIAVKLEDGNLNVTYAVVMELLQQMRIGSENEWSQLQTFRNPPILNSLGEIVGEIRPVFQLHQTPLK
ncbi:asparaginase [Seinonella peptonophila]|uniref:Asparaginase n=1 Tax=Seinonella peptonophila TaxID=112248 RepID=A0A1M5B190_9BACL|nr:asparaginase [Seinonella peptonophila]SHF36087.1 asparaginase [Seinonella peptonophila]